MALLLVKPEYDVWKPGQHNGTFRGNQLAFVAAAETLRTYWSDGAGPAFGAEVRRKGELVAAYLERNVTARFATTVRGLGLIWGIDVSAAGISGAKVSRRCFERGLIVETCGRDSEVIKILPPLILQDSSLTTGLDIIVEALYDEARGDRKATAGEPLAPTTHATP